MQSHQIKTEKLTEWIAKTNVLYASDFNIRKFLYCTLSGGYIVMHKGIVVLETIQINDAVDKYNSIEI